MRETLHFASRLRLNETYTHAQRQEKVEEVMAMLGLTHVADVVVGDGITIKGISGGQLRRVSIGVEIMDLPGVLFLDEPTTGLDSTTSYEVRH